MIQSYCDFIERYNAKRVAIQLPKSWFNQSRSLVQDINNELHRRHCQSVLFIIGDSNYSSCCVDVIAARHVKADCLIHFGETCLTHTNALPIHYAIDSIPLDSSHIASALSSSVLQAIDNVVIFADPAFNDSLQSISLILQQTASFNLFCASIHFQSDVQLDCNAIRTVGGFFVILPKHILLSDCTFVYIGSETSSRLAALQMNHPNNSFFLYSNRKLLPLSVSLNTSISRRYFLIDKIRSSQTIGILINNLVMTSHLQVIRHLQNTISNTSKSSYLIASSCISEEMLSNFHGMIDIFVIVACPFSSIIDSRKWGCEVVTPFELEIALNDDIEWTGEYCTDCTQILTEDEKNDNAGISLAPVLLTDQQFLDAYARLETSSFQGLELGQSKLPATIEQGLKGVPKSYTTV